MTHLNELYAQIVAALEAAGATSPYKADANEPDPRYRSYGVRAAGKAALLKRFRPLVRPLPLPDQLDLAGRLIRSGYGEQQALGLAILEPQAAYFTPERFNELDELVRCLHGWSKIDSFTGSLLRDVLLTHPKPFLELIQSWNQDEDMWLRRASVVLFTRKVAATGRFHDQALAFCNNLKHAPEDLVRKGVGWCLKDLLKHDRPRLLAYVRELRREGVSSVITLYAIRDLKGSERAGLLASC